MPDICGCICICDSVPDVRICFRFCPCRPTPSASVAPPGCSCVPAAAPPAPAWPCPSAPPGHSWRRAVPWDGPTAPGARCRCSWSSQVGHSGVCGCVDCGLDKRDLAASKACRRTVDVAKEVPWQCCGFVWLPPPCCIPLGANLLKCPDAHGPTTECGMHCRSDPSRV